MLVIIYRYAVYTFTNFYINKYPFPPPQKKNCKLTINLIKRNLQVVAVSQTTTTHATYPRFSFICISSEAI